jgi:urease accessory protein
MLAVGIWSAQVGKRGSALVPAAFILFMLIGAALAMTGLQLAAPAIDQVIAASLLLVGLIITFALRMPSSAGTLLAAIFAFFHGYAHGAELHAGLSASTYLLGFTATTSMLLLAGMILALLFHELKKPLALRFAGLTCVLTALLLLGGLL